MPGPRGDKKPREDWAAVVERFMLDDHDQVAYLKLSRLISGFLASRGAVDFKNEWPDLVNDVLAALIRAVQNDMLRDPDAVAGWLRTTTQFKWAERLRMHLDHREDQTVPVEDSEFGDVGGDYDPGRQDVILTIRTVLQRFPEPKRSALMAVYGEGRPYQQVADEYDIPLGTLKHYLRDGMNELRRVFLVSAQET